MYSDGTYLARNPEWHSVDSAWKASQIAGIVAANKISFESVAEVGCGAGGVVAELAGIWPGKRIAGYDISPDAASFWQKHAASGVRYMNSDFLAGDAEADLVLAVDVFEHVADYMGFLRRLGAHGKAFVFHVPLEMHVSALLRGVHVQVREQVGHLHYFSHATALATLRDCGYRVVDERLTDLSQATREGQRGASTALANVARRTVSVLASADLSAKLFGGYSLLVLALREAGGPQTGTR